MTSCLQCEIANHDLASVGLDPYDKINFELLVLEKENTPNPEVMECIYRSMKKKKKTTPLLMYFW